ncbi:hypothetical protein SEA_CHEESETOUCH_50 [Gordonia phage CheeseTouch]
MPQNAESDALYRVLSEYRPDAKWWRAPEAILSSTIDRPHRLSVTFGLPDGTTYTLILSPDLDWTVIHEFGDQSGRIRELWVRTVEQPTAGGEWIEGDPYSRSSDA